MQQSLEDHLPFSEVRPRFQIHTTKRMEELVTAIQNGLARPNAPCKGRVNPGYIVFYIPLTEQHYWSPQLTITLEEENEGVLLRGLYGPRPAVWTMFVFFYSLIVFFIIVVSIVGFSQRSLGMPAGILWLIPVLVLVFLSLYFVAYMGKKLSYEQMLILHHFLEDTTGVRIG